MILATKAAVAHSGVAALPYQWVIADSTNGTLKTSTSTTASSWTTQTSSFGATGINSVASNGTDLYVAVGNSGKLATSPDGITWTQQTSSFSTTNINGVAYYGGTWVAVGASGKLATSSDGVTWTQGTSGLATTLYAIAYGNGLWVFGATQIRTATDPTSTWTNRSSFNVQYNGLWYWPDQSIWLAISNGIRTSTDGITWTSRTSPITLYTGAYGVASNSSVMVAGLLTNFSPLTCDVISSANGTTWTDRTPITAASIYGGATDDAGLLLLVGDKAQTSTDGATWTDRGSTGLSGSYACCHSAGVPAIR